MSEMTGKVVLVTGATNGIGKVTAQAMAARGATVIVHGRSPEKTAAVVEEIKAQTGNANVRKALADLSLVSQAFELAQAIKEKYERLDVLVNNAGSVFTSRQETAEGLEMTFALNHMSYFVVTTQLLDLLKAAAAHNGEARVVSVSSDAHRAARNGINFDNLERRKGYNGFAAYSASKLANVLFTMALAKRLEGTGVSANAVHPGAVATGFGRNNGVLSRGVFTVLGRFMKTPEQGAETSIYVASAPDLRGVTGKYFADCKAVAPAAAAQDAAAERLWQISEQIAARWVAAA